jgi:hypothetical protein
MVCHDQNMIECSVIHPEQRKEVCLGHFAQVFAPLKPGPLPRLISHVALDEVNSETGDVLTWKKKKKHVKHDGKQRRCLFRNFL